MSRDIAGIFTGLVGAADGDVVDVGRLEGGSSNHCLDDTAEQIVRAHFGERAGVAAKQRAQAVVDIGVER